MFFFIIFLFLFCLSGEVGFRLSVISNRCKNKRRNPGQRLTNMEAVNQSPPD